MTIEDWGQMEYMEALQRQETWARERAEGLRGDVLVRVEHKPVYTVGAAPTPQEHAWVQAGQHRGIPVVQTRRGGGITYHEPGQCVLYPIVSLQGALDVHAYLRRLEAACIETLKGFGIEAQTRSGLTGIWIGHAKVGAIGIAIRRCVAYHGLALNNTNSLEPFTYVTPCRIEADQGTVTRLADHVDTPPTGTQITQQFYEHYIKATNGA